MTPVKFAGHNFVFAKDQPPYLPLPAWKKKDDPQGTVVSCWKATMKERIKILFTGKIYFSMLSFNKPLTPNRIYAENPIKYFERKMSLTEGKLKTNRKEQKKDFRQPIKPPSVSKKLRK